MSFLGVVDFEWIYPVGFTVVIAFFLVRGVSASIDLKHKIIGEMEPKHTPPLHERFATKEELKQTNRRLDKIQKMGEAVAEVRTQSNLTYQQLQRMETKLDKLAGSK